MHRKHKKLKNDFDNLFSFNQLQNINWHLLNNSLLLDACTF